MSWKYRHCCYRMSGCRMLTTLLTLLELHRRLLQQQQPVYFSRISYVHYKLICIDLFKKIKVCQETYRPGKARRGIGKSQAIYERAICDTPLQVGAATYRPRRQSRWDFFTRVETRPHM